MPFAGRCGISSSDLPTCPALGFTPAPAVGKGGKGGETKLTREPSFFQSHSASLCLWNVKKYGDLALDILPSTENVLQPPAAVCLSPSLASDVV